MFFQNVQSTPFHLSEDERGSGDILSSSSLLVPPVGLLWVEWSASLKWEEKTSKMMTREGRGKPTRHGQRSKCWLLSPTVKTREYLFVSHLSSFVDQEHSIARGCISPVTAYYGYMTGKRDTRKILRIETYRWEWKEIQVEK